MLIELKNIDKVYKTDRHNVPVLNNINLTIQENDYISLMGASGSGKSTLLNILGMLDTPSSGEYMFNQENVTQLDHFKLAELRNRNIGFVFQSFNLLQKSTSLKNVELPLIYQGINTEIRKERAIHALRRVGLENRIEHYPNELSGGEQQRVAIARALVAEPKIILADEPTGNLDSKTGNDVMTIFNELHDMGHTLFLITHDKKVARTAKRSIYLKDGCMLKEENN